MVISDSGGNLWSITTTALGILQTTSLGAGTAPTGINFNDVASNTTSWTLGVNTSGILTMTSISFSASYPKVLSLGLWNLTTLSSGIIQTTPASAVARMLDLAPGAGSVAQPSARLIGY